ncbi:Plasminogen [Trichinella papuae]|uniref:Plasminogen n=1 Tax=Trichinella papuae TaxID=268474 RepID=A0A0V1M664_9BILA|nr:Plasminogen [Trichinella papuae]
MAAKVGIYFSSLFLLFSMTNLVQFYPGFDPTNYVDVSCLPYSYMKNFTYFGKQDYAADGSECDQWLNHFGSWTVEEFVPHNYCRNINLRNPDGPYCIDHIGRTFSCFHPCELKYVACVDPNSKNFSLSAIYKTTSITSSPCLDWRSIENLMDTNKLSLLRKYLGFWNWIGNACQSGGRPKAAYQLGRKFFQVAPFCIVQKGGLYVEPCHPVCEIAAMKCMPADFATRYKDEPTFGARNVTLSGMPCKRWSDVHMKTYLPIMADTNFCACPTENAKFCDKAGLFCFIDHPLYKWQPCYSTCESEVVDQHGCLNDHELVAMRYLGLRNYTYDGYLCMEWNFQMDKETITLAAEYGVLGLNLCRNLGNLLIGPWCFVQLEDGSTERHACFQTCQNEQLQSSRDVPCYKSDDKKQQTLSINIYSKTYSVNHIPCMRWSLINPNNSKDNYCKEVEENNFIPSCYETATRRLTPCYLNCIGEEDKASMFASEEITCIGSDPLARYSGTRSTTNVGLPCITWVEVNDLFEDRNVLRMVTPHRLGFSSLKEAKTYCRNPDNDPNGPWCVDWNLKKNYCFFRCDDTELRCLDTDIRQMVKYQGPKATTVTGKRCKKKPNRPVLCRNDNFHPLGPFCITEEGTEEPCFPLCTEFYQMSTKYKAVEDVFKLADKILSKRGDVFVYKTSGKFRHSQADTQLKFAFWTFVGALLILTLSCVCFPLLRFMPVLRGYIAAHSLLTPEDQGYRKLVQVFHENGRLPPSFEDFKKKKAKLPPNADPVLLLK